MAPSAAPPGGYAFPDADYLGMELRDFFAGCAITGMLARKPNWPDAELKLDVFRKLSEDAYTIADSMVAQRGRKTEA